MSLKRVKQNKFWNTSLQAYSDTKTIHFDPGSQEASVKGPCRKSST